MKPSKDYQVFHNSNIRPSYAIGGELECNRKGYEAKELKEQIINEAKQAYKQRTKRAFQAKSYEWSAVVNIKPNTTMQDLEALAKHFNDKYGFQCYQIAIHRDEGHINEQGEKQINHHAHLEFITLDKETGRNRQREIKPQTLRQIQSEVAQILQMQRGVDKRISKVERIEPRQYARQKEAEKKSQKEVSIDLNKQIKELEQQQKKALQEADEAFRTERKRMIEVNNALIEIGLPKIYDKEQYIDLGKWRDLAKEKIEKAIQIQISDLKKQQEQEAQNNIKTKEGKALTNHVKKLNLDRTNLKTFEDYHNAIDKAIDDKISEIENLKSKINTLETQNKALQEQNDTKDREIIALKQGNGTLVNFNNLKTNSENETSSTKITFNINADEKTKIEYTTIILYYDKIEKHTIDLNLENTKTKDLELNITEPTHKVNIKDSTLIEVTCNCENETTEIINKVLKQCIFNDVDDIGKKDIKDPEL